MSLPAPPTATPHNQTGVAPGTSIALSTLFTYSSASGDTVLGFDFKETTNDGGYITDNLGNRLTPGVLYGSAGTGIPISELSQYHFVAGLAGSTSDTVNFNVEDQYDQISTVVSATVTAATPAPPTATPHNQTGVAAGTSIALSTLFTYSSASGDTVLGFDFKETTNGGGYITDNLGNRLTPGVLYGGAGTGIPIIELSQYHFVAGPGGTSDTVAFNVEDQYNQISTAVSATVSVQIPTPAPPTATPHNQTGVAVGASIALSTLFTYSSASGDTVLGFDFEETTNDGGYITDNLGNRLTPGVLYGSAGTGIPISELSQYHFVAGPGGTSDTVAFNVEDQYNQISTAVSATVSVQIPTPAPPTATPHNQTGVAVGASIALSTLFTYSSASGDTVLGFDFEETTNDGGYITDNLGNPLTPGVLYGSAGTGIPISELSQYHFVAGPGGTSDTVAFNVEDQYNQISTAVSATVSVQIPTPAPPTATPHNQTGVAQGTSIALSTLFTYSSASGDTVLGFDFKETTNDGGYITDNLGNPLTPGVLYGSAGTGIPISELSQYHFVAGLAGTSDTVAFNVEDQYNQISTAVSATVSVQIPTPAPPTATPHNQTGVAQGTSIALSTLFTYSSASGDTVLGFDFKETTNDGGYITDNLGNPLTPGVLYGSAGTGIPISELSQYHFVAGPGGTSDTVNFNVEDQYDQISTVVSATVSTATTPAAPTASPHNQTGVAQGTSIALSTLFTYSSASGDTVLGFDFKETTNDGGYITDNLGNPLTPGVLYGSAGTGIPISELSQYHFVAGPGGTSDTVNFNVEDQYDQISTVVSATVTAQGGGGGNQSEKGIDVANAGYAWSTIASLASQIIPQNQFIGLYIGNESNYPNTTETQALISTDHLQIISIYEKIDTTNGVGMADSYFDSVGRPIHTFGWESYLTEAQGEADASRAFTAAKQAGQVGGAIYFAMDFDPNDVSAVPAGQDFVQGESAAAIAGFTYADAMEAITEYFEGIDNYFGKNGVTYAIGIYGAGDVIETIKNDELATYTWQTSAKSWGILGPDTSANITQSAGNNDFSISTDPDVTSAQSFGAWGATTSDSGDTSPPILGNDNPLSAQAGTTIIITSSLLSAADNTSDATQLNYTITTAPADGSLLLNGSATSSFTQDDINNNLVSYKETVSGANSDVFFYKVTDAAGNSTGVTPFQINIGTPTYDSNGNLISQTFTNANGIQWANSYDPLTTSNLMWSTSSYDANGNLTSQTGTNIDGTHWLSMYDVNNQYSWSNVTINFDALWNQTSITGTNDNGTHNISAGSIASAYDTLQWFATPFNPNWNSTAGVSLAGNSENDTLVGGAGDDTFTAGTGNDLFYGNGGSNTFVFGPGSGKDTIADFQPTQDTIQFNPALFANYAAVLQNTTQVGANTVIQHDANSSVTLENVAANSLTANNFHFS